MPFESNVSVPLVSIVCITYNHRKYIAQAIESFLRQKTSFSYEIIIHDDASTDGTQKIIATYGEMHPRVIRTIFQTENQYSRGKKIWGHICFHEAKGKYIALCEGDDYWIAEEKLQKQIDVMEKDGGIVMVCSNSYAVSEDSNIIKKVDPYENTGYISAAEIINSKRPMLSTCTVVFRREVLEYRKKYYDETMTEDYPLEVLCATHGEVYYFNDVMAAYRRMVPGSWSAAIQADPSNGIIDRLALTTSRFLLNVDKDTNGRYESAITWKIARYLKTYKPNQETDMEYDEIKKHLPLVIRGLLYAMKKMPKMFGIMKNISVLVKLK